MSDKWEIQNKYLLTFPERAGEGKMSKRTNLKICLAVLISVELAESQNSFGRFQTPPSRGVGWPFCGSIIG
jgi:hypothetical protein